MRVGIDVDGVLVDFNTAFIERVKKVTRRNLFEDGYEPDVWNYPVAVGYTTEEIDRVWTDIKLDPDFWATLPRYKETFNALDCIDRLMRQKHDIYFITNRMGIQAKEQTEVWLMRNWPRVNPGLMTVLLSGEKGLCAEALNLDLYVDDKDTNVWDVAHKRNYRLGLAGPIFEPKTKVFLLDRPWNAHVSDEHGIRRIKTLPEMFDA